MKDIPKDDIKKRDLAYNASKDVLKTVGIMPTTVTAQTLYNIYNDNRQQTVITSDYQKFLDFKAKQRDKNVDNLENDEENSDSINQIPS